MRDDNVYNYKPLETLILKSLTYAAVIVNYNHFLK